MKKAKVIKQLTKRINSLRPTIIRKKKLEWLEGIDGGFKKRRLVFHTSEEVDDFIRSFKCIIPLTVDSTMKQKGQIFRRDIQPIFFKTISAMYDTIASNGKEMRVGAS